MKNSYNKITLHTIKLLQEIAGEKNVLSGEGRENYAQDETPQLKPVLPEAVVKPENTAAVAAILKLADKKRIPITPRGAGTGLSGGAVAIQGGIVLSLEKMNRILEIDEDNFSATVEAGVTLADFQQAVEQRGLYYPLYPGEKSATLGGNVATNAGGLRAVKYGVTRHFVLGLEAVLPNGEIIQSGGKYFKCSTGYDLTQLLTGSEGTLAVITKITLKLIAPPGIREILFIPFVSLQDAIGTVPAILKAKILPVGMEFISKGIIEMVEQFTGKEIPHHGHDAYLLLIIEAEDSAEFCRITERITEICLQHGALDVFVPGSEHAKKNLLEAREKFFPTAKHFGMLEIADVVVPRSKIADFIEKARQLGEEYCLSITAYGHAGDGNVHLHPVGPLTEDNKKKAKEMLKKAFIAGIEMGGTISGEHGIGFTKKGYLPLAMSPEKIALMRRLKRAFDPHNILNPGKVFDI